MDVIFALGSCFSILLIMYVIVCISIITIAPVRTGELVIMISGLISPLTLLVVILLDSITVDIHRQQVIGRFE